MTGQPKWVLNIPPVKCPSDMTRIPQTILDDWRTYVGSIEPSDGDYEDWVETACRLHYGLKHLPNPLVRIPHVWQGDDGKLCGLPHYGMVMKYPTIDQIREPGDADRYQLDPCVRMLMHRHTISCSTSPEDTENAFSQLLLQGVTRFKVKYMHSQKKLPLLDLDGTDVKKLCQQVYDWLEWETVHAEDDPHALLVQERVRMEYEYRMFMVGDTPVTGAGCLEDHTPLDNSERFDPWMEKTRNRGGLERRFGLTERYRGFARRCGRLLADRGYEAYTLDLCLIDGSVSVIELNGLMNAGLYACNMDALLSAVARHPEQMIPKSLKLDQEEGNIGND